MQHRSLAEASVLPPAQSGAQRGSEIGGRFEKEVAEGLRVDEDRPAAQERDTAGVGKRDGWVLHSSEGSACGRDSSVFCAGSYWLFTHGLDAAA